MFTSLGDRLEAVDAPELHVMTSAEFMQIQ